MLLAFVNNSIGNQPFRHLFTFFG
uniref:Uncharacterized protein MANES_17G111900 n=1 Tax=Rhizophora mucronata TaxID=61149 RepID=A0A2P2JGX1_RHIMU